MRDGGGDDRLIQVLIDSVQAMRRAASAAARRRGELGAGDWRPTRRCGTAGRSFQRAVDLLPELESPFSRARAQLEYAELLVAAGDPRVPGLGCETRPRACSSSCGRRRGWNGRTRFARRCRRDRLRILRRAVACWPALLWPVRLGPVEDLLGLRHRKPAREPVLRLVWDRACGDCAATALPTVAPVAERRLVSVLFADLVGFTTLSEHRDPEEVRELLSQYFDRCRSLDRAVRRDGGEVHRRCGDGGVGDAGGARGRRRAGGAGGAGA